MKGTRTRGSDPMTRVINGGVEEIHNVNHVLARCFRILLFKSNISAAQWKGLLIRKITRLRAKQTSKELASYAGNLAKRLAAPEITWNKFMEGLDVLEVEKMDLTIVIWRNGKPLSVELTISDISSHVNDDDDEEDS